MTRQAHPILQIALLVAIGLRTIIGAPCCLEPVNAASAAVGSMAHHDHHAHHSQHAHQSAHHGSSAKGDHGDHSDHTDHANDPSANSCCSACGPTLPPDPVNLAIRSAPKALPQPAPVRALATRPPFPAYDARGPPHRV
ncbi:MAG: hypothetical protein AAGH57_09370 [Pseudomonadota bacterium]